MHRWAALLLALTPATLMAAEEPIRRAPESIGPGSALQVIFALALVVGLIGVMGWLMRRFGGVPGAGGSGALRVVTAISVGQRERVVLIQAGEKQLLLGVAPGRVEALHVLDQPIELQSTGGSERFADRFASALKKRGG